MKIKRSYSYEVTGVDPFLSTAVVLTAENRQDARDHLRYLKLDQRNANSKIMQTLNQVKAVR